MIRSNEGIRIVLSWVDVMEAVEELARLAPGPGIQRIIGVARGGLVPATLLAHRLRVRRIEAVNIYARNYDGSALFEPVVQGFPPPMDNTNTVIVEDIVDTGRTYEVLRRLYPGVPVVALVSRLKVVPGAIAVPPGAWVIFPWEEA